MTPAPLPAVATKLADLRAVPLGEMAALAPIALEKVVQRVLPGTQQTVSLGTSFGSSV